MYQKIFWSFVFWTVTALGATLIPIRSFSGGGQPFTAFEFVGPLGGALFGGLVGAVAATAAKGIGFWIAGGAVSAFALARLLTPAAAAIYLDGRQRWILAVPVLAMLAFWLHPVGRTVWYYALYWLIPLATWPYRRNLFVRSLGATFIAHALGGALFIWLAPTGVALWKALIPIVVIERLTFAAGMSLALLGFEWTFQHLPWLARSLGTVRLGTELRVQLGR